MGMQDRDWYREVQKERERQTVRFGKSNIDYKNRHSAFSRGSRWELLGIVLFWLAIMGALYFGFKYYEKPKMVISANGDIVIQRARDGHFYVAGFVNGKPVKFLVDTGASLVGVSEQFAQRNGLIGGTQTTFNTANGPLPGRIVANVPVKVGPIAVSGIRVGVGLEGHEINDALLGQNFLSKFDVHLRENSMILRARRSN